MKKLVLILGCLAVLGAEAKDYGFSKNDGDDCLNPGAGITVSVNNPTDKTVALDAYVVKKAQNGKLEKCYNFYVIKNTVYMDPNSRAEVSVFPASGVKSGSDEYLLATCLDCGDNKKVLQYQSLDTINLGK